MLKGINLTDNCDLIKEQIEQSITHLFDCCIVVKPISQQMFLNGIVQEWAQNRLKA